MASDDVLDRFEPQRLERAWALLAKWTADDNLPAAAAVVGSSRGVSLPRHFGRQRVAADSPALSRDALFLIASPTKPIVATALMMLVEAGQIQLVDPVIRYVPEFGKLGKRAITLAHCLTHTSGLPDMLPDNDALRVARAPLTEFLARTCELKPDFLPGRNVQYQSLGFLMIAEVVQRVTGQTIREFLAERILSPLGMQNTWLGLPTINSANGETIVEPELRARVAELRIGPVRLSGASHWNGDYWLALGAPWGGLVSTPYDLGIFASHLLSIHGGDQGIITRATLDAMTSNQLERMPEVPEIHRRCFPWGYGWQLEWPTHPTTFGALLSPTAYGHWGATGTLVWIDPERDAFAVVLSTQPVELGRRRLTQFTSAVCAAIV